MSMKIPAQVIIQFRNEAQKRGYDKDQRHEYVSEKKELYKNAAKANDMIVGGTLAATAVPIIKKASKVLFTNPEGVAGAPKKFRYGLKRAVLEQFGPLVKEFKKFDKALDKNKGFFQSMATGFKHSLNMMGGFCKSIPKPIAITAASLLALSTIKYHAESNKIDAKHDTVKYLKEKAVASEE